MVTGGTGPVAGVAGSGGGGQIGVPPVVMPPPPPPAECLMAGGGPKPGLSELRRLTPREYDNTILELLGDASAPGRSFPAQKMSHGFDNSAEAALIEQLHGEQYETAADRVAATAVAKLPALLGCTPTNAATEDSCAKEFIPSFGLRAFRRPLAPDEVTRYVGFYTASKTKYGFQTAIKLVTQAFLQSPFFLYRVEGVGTAQPGVVKASPYEIATRLSYLIWSSMPDKILFDEAAAGRLTTATEIASQASRMLADQRARAGIKNFFGQWLEIANLDKATKDAATFGKWTANTAGLLRQEHEAFVEKVILEENGTVETLLTAPFSYLNKELATYYGASGPTGTAFVKTTFPTTAPRAGILSQGAFLAAFAKPTQTNPVSRGYLVRDRILCAPPPPAPANVPELPKPDGRLSTRERLAMHRQDPACSACHAIIDPPGFAFERYDGIGLWRTQDAGKAIDSTGMLIGVGDADGAFTNAVDMMSQIARSRHGKECVAEQYFQFAFGRPPVKELTGDKCTLEVFTSTLMSSGGSFKQFVLTLTQSEPFMYRTQIGGAL